MNFPPKLPFRFWRRIDQKASFSLKLRRNQIVTVDTDIEILEVASSDDDSRSDRSSDIEDEETKITRKSLASDHRYRMKLPSTLPFCRRRSLDQCASLSQHPCPNQKVDK